MGHRKVGVWHSILDSHPSERMGSSQQDMEQGTNQKTLMVKFGLNSKDSMDEFRYLVNHGTILNPANRHPFSTSCFLAQHTRPMHGAKAKPTVDLPQMLVNNVPLPNACGGEIPDRNIALANVPEWTSRVQVTLVADQIHAKQLANCKQ